MGSVPAAPCEDILACPGSCGNIWKESLPCVADSLRLSHSGHFAHLTLVSDDRSARDRETLKALSLLYTAHWYPRIFTLVRANSPNSRRVLPFFIINCFSDSSAIPRHNRSISVLSRHIFCPPMTGHQLLSSLYYLCSEAAALSRLVRLLARTDEREGMRMEMQLTAWTQTESSVFTHSSNSSSRGTRPRQFGAN